MARTDKQLSYEERYKEKMEKYKEVYKIRTEFASKFKLKSEKTEGYSETGDSTAVSSETASDDSAAQGDYSGVKYDPNNMTKEQLINANLKGSCGISESDLNAWIARGAKNNRCVVCGGNHMEGRAAAFLKGEKEFGIRADAMIAHAAHESGWGSSKICHDKANFFGINAVDSSPYASATGWDGYNGGITGGMGWVAEGYTYRSKKKSSSPDQDTFYLMLFPQASQTWHSYASDKKWHTKICAIWAGAPKGKEVGEKASTTSTSNTKATTSNASIKTTFQVTRDIKTQSQSTDEDIMEFESSKNYMKYSVLMDAPPGKMRSGVYVPPSTNRKDYARYRLENAFIQKWQGWAPLDSSRFIHLAGPQENMYSSEARVVFELLRTKLGWNKIKVVHGFQPYRTIGLRSMHNAGIAMDIYVENIYEAIYVADTAWSLGVRAVAIGGADLDETQSGFVHIDCGPKGFWVLNHHDVYKGPGTFKFAKG